MKAAKVLPRRIEWLVSLSYIGIVVVEIIVLRNLSRAPEANLIRYLAFFSIIYLSIVIIRQQIIKPVQQMRAFSLQISAGNFQQRLPDFHNIELNELAQAFNSMVNTIENSETRRVALIGDVAHELRTPLNNIKITVEGLIDQVLVADPNMYFNIQHEVSRLQRLVSQLELLSRVESDQIFLTKKPTNLKQLIFETNEKLAVQFHDKKVALNTTFSSELPMVLIDSDRITQVLINLMGNALQYTPAGGKVTISVKQDVEKITVAVSDTGGGLAQDDLEKIFERFYRVDKSRARHSGGNGIGLTIAKHLVLAHGGSIWAESEGISKGATVLFTIPINKD